MYVEYNGVDKMFSKIKFKIAKRHIVTITLMIVVFVMSLGYAALSQYMEIEGMAIVQRVWNVYVSEITPTSTNGGSWLYQNETYQNVVSLQTTLPNLNSTVTLSSTNPSGCSSQNGTASCPYVIG